MSGNNEDRRERANRSALRNRIYVGWDIDYDQVCRLFEGQDEPALLLWELLGDRLGGRAQWHFAVSNYGMDGIRPAWGFGAGRASLLVASIDGLLVSVYDDPADTNLSFANVNEFMAWAEPRERELAGYNPLAQQILEDEGLLKGLRELTVDDDLTGKWIVTRGASESHLLMWHEPHRQPLFDTGMTYCNRDGGPPYMAVHEGGRLLPRCPLCEAA